MLTTTAERDTVLAFLEIERRLDRIARRDAATSGRLRLELVRLRRDYSGGRLDPDAARERAASLLETTTLLESTAA